MKYFVLLILFLATIKAYSQELPPIIKYAPEDYHADNQNWMISQDEDNDFIYVANNKGLLEFNGSDWNVYPTPNNTIIRSVKVVDNKVYTGCYADFGYWVKNHLGVLEYHSLKSKLEGRKLEDEEIWNIISYNEWVIFQSNRSIYLYHSENQKFKIIDPTDIIFKIFKVGDKIYYHVANQGIYTITGGEASLVSSNSTFIDDRVIGIFNSEGQLMILTRNSGFFRFNDNQVLSWKISADKNIKDKSIYSCLQLHDGSYVLGTVSDGLIHLNARGELKYEINQAKGLGNNTVLSLFEDSFNNIWTGLDNGINCINSESPIKTFTDFRGVLGTVYSARLFKGILYIGSNQGLFYRKMELSSEPFKFIEGTSGQVWSLYDHNNETLFCGHHFGTFLIQGNKAQKISNNLGAWTFKTLPNKQNIILQGNYDGIYVLEKNDQKWVVRNKIKGFTISSRYLEINDSLNIWVNHEYKGVFHLKINDSLTSAEDVDFEDGLPLGKNSSLITYKDNLLYTSNEGVFRYNRLSKSFQLDTILSPLIINEGYDSKIITGNEDKLWVYSSEFIRYIENDDINNTPKIFNIPIPSSMRKGVLGYENIARISENNYIIGTTNGYLNVDISKIDNEFKYLIYLNSIEIKNPNNQQILYPVDDKSEFDYNEGILKFKYSIPQYSENLIVKYQYKLDGIKSSWSPWTKESEVTFENLSFGDYRLLVKGKVGNQLTENVISYEFKVKRPWYISNLAIITYLLFVLTISLIIHHIYKWYYGNKIEHEKLENEQVVMQIKNEKLNQEIENRNRELAISTMSIIKKNKVLKGIKKELKKSNSEANKAAISLIDKNLNDSQDWSFFEQAFNNADKDFLDKIYQVHPNLTPNDLRFCAYLRLNLSSKEIAPLLNISPKSVETKRYRLRKKLGLDHDDGLVSYILKF